PEDFREDVRLLGTEVDRTQRLVRGFLELARSRPSAPEPIRPAAAVDEVIGMTRHLLADVELVIDVPDTLPDVTASAADLRQALTIVTLNAIEALGGRVARGSLAIRGITMPGEGGRCVGLSVEDTAAPVPPADRDLLFDPLPPRGTSHRAGLGLAVGRSLARGMGGDLRYRPTASGANTLMLLLPCSERAGTPAPRAGTQTRTTPAGGVPPSGGNRGGADDGLVVLVCDDEVAIRSLIGRVLRRAGMQMLEASTGAAALEILRQQPVDVIMADQRMAEMTGMELHAAAIEVQPDLQAHFILMSGDAGEAELAAFSRRSGVEVLSKPFELTTLAARIREFASR
ncbi:MAG: response regulator, partial [Chloroflexota bacterium]